MRMGAGRLLVLVAFSLLGVIVRPSPAGAGPLQQLSLAADTYLVGRTGDVGVAVVAPGRRLVYGARSGARLPLASVAKLAIMVTVLDRSIRAHQQLTARELTLLEAMLAHSDNDAASTLWDSVGGAAVRRYLHSIGLTDFEPGAGVHWGASVDTAADIARLLAGLADGSILDASHRALALVLMSRVDPSQRWGVTAGLPPGAMLAFKNGWNELSDGEWQLNSAGVVLPGRVDRAYALVVLTQAQPNLQYGLQTIQHLAELVHTSIAASR